MRYPGFCGDSYVSQSPIASVARTVNFYPEMLKTEAPKAPVVLYPTPGLRTLATTPEGVGRGAFAERGRKFVVFGSLLMEVLGSDAVPQLVVRGTMVTDQWPVTMTTNGTGGQQIAITSGNRLYIFDLRTNTFTGPVLEGARQVVYLNGRFVVLDCDTENTSRLRIGELLNGLVWVETKIAPRDDASDLWRSLAISKSKELWLLGEHTGSIYYDAGGPPQYMAPRQGVLVTPGILAPYSLVEVAGSMMWLAEGKDGAGTVVRAQGYSAETVSPEPANYAFSQYERLSRIDDAVAWTYEQQGHTFYVINFPTANATWVYDLTTNWWHERGSYNGASDHYDVWGPQFHMHQGGIHYVVDHRVGRLYDMSLDYVTDTDMQPLRRLRIAPGIQSEQHLMFYDDFRLYLETGLGLAIGQGSDPMLALRISDDGGKTFGSERWRSAGRIGNTRQGCAQWWQLGSSTDRVFSVSMADPIPWRLIDAYLTVREGPR